MTTDPHDEQNNSTAKSTRPSFEDAREYLKEHDHDFQKMYEKHLKIDHDLCKLETCHYLTPEEEIREKQLKKDKFRLKDQMAHRINEYRDQFRSQK